MATDSEMSLTSNQRSELGSIAQSRSLPAGYVFRARLILMLAQGASFNTIKRRLQTSAPTIIRWKQRFLETGLDGLDTYHPGQKATVLPPALRARILSATRKKPSDGSTHWSCRKLATALGVSKDAVHRVWKEAALKPYRLERYLASDDPEFESKAADIIDLYLRPPQHADRHSSRGSARSRSAAFAGKSGASRLRVLPPRNAFTVCSVGHPDRARAPHTQAPPHQPGLRGLPRRSAIVVLAPAADSYHPRQPLGPQNTTRSRLPSTASARAAALHPYVFLLAQPSGDLVRQDRTRGHRPRHFHLSSGLGSQTPPLHQRVLRQRSPDPVEILFHEKAG